MASSSRRPATPSGCSGRRPSPTAGTSVTINDTAPTADRWNLAAIEIMPRGHGRAGADGPRPGLKTDSVTATSVDAELDGEHRRLRRGRLPHLSRRHADREVTRTAFSDTGVSPGTSYAYTVRAYDAAGNFVGRVRSQVVTPRRPTPAPTVQLSAPAAGATVSGTVSVRPTATDNVGVAGVQFLLDGNRWAPRTRARRTARRGTRRGRQRVAHALRTRPRRGRQRHDRRPSGHRQQRRHRSRAVGQWGPVVAAARGRDPLRADADRARC